MTKLKNAFLHPSDEFTPIPFWFWNDRLTHEEIIRQIHDFHEKGVTGFVLHPRMGIPKEIEYLSDSFMAFVLTAVQEAEKLQMTVILYDEAMYPSGSAKGMVVKDHPEYASRGLKMMEYPCEGETTVTISLEEGERFVSGQAVEKLADNRINYGSTELLEMVDGKVSFTPPNDSNWSLVCFIETFTKGTIRGVHEGEDDRQKDAPASADLLNPKAVQKFINLTHDRYYETLKDHFGKTVIAFFTDEPDLLGRNSIRGLKPWTENFLDYYKEMGNRETDLPALWFDIDDQTDLLRRQYKKAIHKRMGEAYYGPLSQWCHAHKVALTGHPAASDDIGLLDFFQIPGQDVVWRWVAPEDEKGIKGHHSTAGKCSADAARHRGRRRNLNEVLGVCGIDNGWHLPGGDMKWYFDWLFVRGVNLISPHAFYYSIRGRERSHERPPDVGANNIWWPHYKQFSTYIKRMSWLMTDSVNQAQIAILCDDDFLPWKIAKPLYEQQLEFNYLEESLLQQTEIKDGHLEIAKQRYRAILIEDRTRFSDETLHYLETFTDQGGAVFYLDENTSLSSICDDLLQVIHEEVQLAPACKDIRLSLVEKEGHFFYLFVNEGEEAYDGSIQLARHGFVEKWNPWEGTIKPIAVNMNEGNLVIPLQLQRRESIIIQLDPDQVPSLIENPIVRKNRVEQDVEDKWAITFNGTKLAQTTLFSWTEHDEWKHLSGAMTYEQTFHLHDITDVVLDLGEVHELAEVWLNGQGVGVKMWAPYRFDIGEYVVAGDNHLKIKVTNSRANEMDQLSLPSGLLGPVKLIYSNV